jgi:catechol 2,3-dioxygenase-like lactoylglutathione lyase family enzyme
MIDFMHSAAVKVRDHDAAIDYFVNKLGFELTADIPMGSETDRWVTVRPKGSATALALIQTTELLPPGQGNSGITFIAKDLDTTYAELSGRGVSFDGPPEAMPWGAKAAWITDPDGNSFFVTDTE